MAPVSKKATAQYNKTIVPIGPGGTPGHLLRMIVMIITGGFVYPNTFVEGMDLSGRSQPPQGQPDGDDDRHGEACPSDLVDWLGTHASADVVAVTNSEVVVIEREALREFVRQNPEFAFELIGRIIRRARTATNSARNMALLDAYGRLTNALEAIASQPAPDGTRECEPISQAELASRVGCSREMVSRLMTDLAKGGYVETSRRRIVLKRKFPARW